MGPDRLLSFAKAREKLQLGQEGQGRTREWFIRTMAHLVARLAALVAGCIALGHGAVGAQVTRLAAIEALAVQRPFLARHLALCSDVAGFAAVVAGDPAAAGVAAAGGEGGHSGVQGAVNVD